MNVATLLAEFEAKGIALWEESGRLRYRAPRGAMSPELLEALRADKEAVLARLRTAAEAAEPEPAAVWSAEPERRYEPFALTEVQAAYLLGRTDVFAYGGAPCHIYLEFALPAQTDARRLAEAWDRVVARHDMLRAVVFADGRQQVLETAPDSCALHWTDLRGRAPEEVAAAIEAVRDELSHRMHPLGEEPLYELRLTLADEHAVLHLSVDFTAFDYVSIQLALAELDQLYRDPAAEAPRPEATFRDYSAARDRLRASDAYARDRAYWLDRLDELPGAPALPQADAAGAASPAASSPGPARFTRHGLVLDEPAWRALKERATRHGVTASGAVLAAYAEVIGKWSGARPFTLNLTLLDRRPLHPQIDLVVGDFTAVSLLAVEPDAAAFADRAGAIGARLFDDLDHSLYSGVETLRELAKAKGRDAALAPIVFTSGIGVAARAAQAAGGIAPRPRYGISQTPQVWIDCQAGDQFGELDVNWDVRDGVLPEGLAATMFEAFERLLRRLAADDACWTDADPVAVPAEQLARRRAANATDAPVPEVLLHEPLVARALAEPDRIAIVDGAGTATYGEWLRRATAVAAALDAAGLRAGDHVGILLPKGRLQLAAVLGTLLAGGVYLPVGPDQPTERRDAILASSGTRFALHSTGDGPFEGALPEGVAAIPVDTLPPAALPAAAPARRVGPADPAYVIHTSGSTGRPKGVVISHRAAANTVHDINARYGVGSEDRVLGLAALGFDLSVYDLFGPTALGAALVLPDPARRGDPSHWAELLERHGVTLWNSVPAQLQMLADYLDHAPAARPRLRVALLSGDWIPLGLPEHARRHLPETGLISLGGATEAAIWSIAHPIDRVLPHWRSIPYGRPLANQRFHVLDPALRDCPDLVAGELYIAGVGLADGYLNDPEQTAAAFPVRPGTGERLYRTGDLGRYLPDGEIEFLGRRDQQVKIRGHRIELGEVEAVLAAHPAVAAAVVVAEGERALERRLVAFAEPAFAEAAARRDADARAEQRIRELAARCAAIGEPALPDREALAGYHRALEELMLLGFGRAFSLAGLFASAARRHTFDEIAARTGTVPEHLGLLRRALRALEREAWLERVEAAPAQRASAEDAGPAWRGLRQFSEDALERAWTEFDKARPPAVCPDELAGYFRAAAQAVPAMLRGQGNATHLFFPEGDHRIARAWYADNDAARRLNAVLATVVAGLAAERAGTGPVRILEVGGGIGAATEAVLPALEGLPAEYRFTDVSEFFLSDARERFGARPGVRFGLFDMNRDPHGQGLAPNSFDLVLGSGALNNARDTGEVLARLRGLLAPGGWLVINELTREHAEVTASQAFMMEEPQDVRGATDTVFVDRDEWLRLLADAGGECVLCLPGADEALALLGWNVFAARFKSERVATDAQRLTDWLRTRLPGYMVPADIQLLDEIPLTGNGKVDRRRLAASAVRQAGRAPSAEGSGAPRDELERSLAERFAAALGCPSLGRDQDFFESGGDSLLAARLVGQLRGELPEAAAFGFDELLRGLLSAPRVSAFADLLRSAAPTGGGNGDSAAAAPRTAALISSGRALVPMGGSGPGPLRVLVHEGLGTLAPLRALARELAGQGPVAGLAVPDKDSYLARPAESLFESLAADYAKELIAAGHRGAQIVGYCSGGLIAAELAGALVEAGDEDVRLTVVSSYRVPYRIGEELMAQYAFVRAMGADPAEHGWPADEQAVHRILRAALARTPGLIPAGSLADAQGDPELAETAERFAELAARDQQRRLAELWSALAERDAGLGSADYVADLYAVFRLTVEAVTRYDPPPYAGDIIFLRPRQPTHFIPGLHRDMTAFWEQLCVGRLTVLDVPGDHFGCVRLPAVRSLAGAVAGAGR